MLESQVRKLIDTFRPDKASNISEVELDRTIRKTQRLLSAHEGNESYESYENMVQRLRQMVVNEKSVVPFLELCSKLQLSAHISKKWQLLQLLELLTTKEKAIIDTSAHSCRYEQEQYISALWANPKNVLNDGHIAMLKGEMFDELLLIRDILYASQGIETRLIETRNNEYCAKTSLRLLPSQRVLIQRLCLIGALHNRLLTFISRGSTQSLVLQSFVGSLQQELTNLYELFGCLHSKLQQCLHCECGTANRMTLARLHIWFAQPLRRLQLLSKYCDCGHGQFSLSQIFKFSRSGNAFEYSLTQAILNEISRPIFDMINKWIFEGVLCDPFAEFFIFENRNYNTTDIWKKKYVLVRKHIPIFLSKKVAKQIYSIGRNLNFIRFCCLDTTPHNTVTQTFNYNNLDKFECEINKLALKTNQKLMDLMMNKFAVMRHCESLRHYLLLVKGDFIAEFLYEIRGEMGKNASLIKQHSIQSKLESVFVKFESENNTRLKVKILSNSSLTGDIGWNVFTLHYCVDLPINIIFNEAAMKKYQRIFVFLMKIKLAKSVLNDCWKRQMKGKRRMHQTSHVSHMSYLVCNCMKQLLQIFESYFMFDVLETEWRHFVNGTYSSMDQLIAAHHKYISQIVEKCFILKKPFMDILTQIHQFKELCFANVNEIVYIWKSFHHKIDKLLQLSNDKAIPEYLERLLVQLDFNDYFLRLSAPKSKHLLSKKLDSVLDKAVKPKPKQFVPNFVFPKVTNKSKNILAKYDIINTTPKIDSKIPKHLLPTPLKNNSNDSIDFSLDKFIPTPLMNQGKKSKSYR